MSNIEKILRAAKNTPEKLRFKELCKLAEAYGFLFSRQRGSHVVYKRPGQMAIMTFQNDRGMAKAYQVKQLLEVIDEISSNE